MPNKIAFVTWYSATRSRVLARTLNADLITIKYKTKVRLLRLIFNPILIAITFFRLLSQNYEIVLAQIPPIGSAIAGFLYAKLFSKKIIFDTHSGLFFPQAWHQNLYLLLYRIMLQNITMNLVHNEGIYKRNLLKNTRTIVLEDKLPFNLPDKPLTEKEKFRVAVICGYGQDEPIQAILESIRLIPEIEFYLTGNSENLKDNYPIPQNLILTGYLSNEEYETCLKNVHAIIALTSRPDTVLCGAYEAVSLGKPLITSNTPILRKYFSKGTIHTQNDSIAIAESLKILLNNYERLQKETLELRKEKETLWQKQFMPLEELLA
ncbi:MAG: glycosyltransferase [candidate division WOR-3 bacterium]|nr:glycosyltransferase [candidate division WOR-3 bacterium]